MYVHFLNALLNTMMVIIKKLLGGLDTNKKKLTTNITLMVLSLK